MRCWFSLTGGGGVGARGVGRGAEVIESPSTTRLLLTSHRYPNYRAFREEA